MASELSIFSIYRAEDNDDYYLIRTERPSYSNASQTQEDLANEIEQLKRECILDAIAKRHNPNCHKNDFAFIGEYQGYPVGDILYLDHGSADLNIYYLETGFGQPWIIIGNASSEADFLMEIKGDEDLVGLQPFGKPIQVKATFITENDFDLSGVVNHQLKDVRVLFE